MSFGDGVVGEVSPARLALEQFSLSVDHLVKIAEDGGLDGLDTSEFVTFTQDFERIRNRIPLADHRIVADAERRNLPEVLTQPNMVRMLMSTLRLSPGEASRRVRAAAAVGDRQSMLGEPLTPIRPHLAAAQRTGEIIAEQVAIVERALAKVDHRGFDPADLDDGEQLLTRFAGTFGPKDLKNLADQVVDHIDPDGSRPQDELNAARRHVHLRPTKDGGWAGEFRLTGEAGTKLQALLGPLATPRLEPELKDHPAVAPDTRHHGQRMHDALEDVCDRLLRGRRNPDPTNPDPTMPGGTIAGGTIPDAGGTPATVIITFTIEDLLATTGYAVASDGTLIRTETALKLADSGRHLFRRRHRQRSGAESGPDAQDRHPRPNHRVDRPRPRLLLPRLRHTPRLVRTAPHPGLDRRRRDEPGQPHLVVPLPPPHLRRPRLDLPTQRRRTPRHGPHRRSSTGTNGP